MSDLTARYRVAQQLPDDAVVTEDMVLRHWELERELERELARELRASVPDNRWEVFDRCYTRLYEELPWLNACAGVDPYVADESEFQEWA